MEGEVIKGEVEWTEEGLERERASKGRGYRVEREWVLWEGGKASAQEGKRGGRRGIGGERLKGREERHRRRKTKGEGEEASAQEG